ncbi:MAG: hypothetical protein V9E86_01605 [Nitrosomonas sp.]
MPLMPVNALNRILTWGDFTQKNLPAPAPGTSITAAETQVNISSTGIRFIPVPGSAPRQFRLDQEPTVTVNFLKRSWVANFVFTWSQADQSALLDHEQTHYLIAALSARDFFNELLAIRKRDYSSSQAGIADVKAAQKLLINQDIQDKYDQDTKHLPTVNVMVQQVWSQNVQATLRFNQPLRAQLKRATLIR